jgi:hypothetical protein
MSRTTFDIGFGENIAFNYTGRTRITKMQITPGMVSGMILTCYLWATIRILRSRERKWFRWLPLAGTGCPDSNVRCRGKPAGRLRVRTLKNILPHHQRGWLGERLQDGSPG